MIGIEEAVQRAIDTKSQMYNQKDSCPEHERDIELRNLYTLASMAPDGPAAELGVKRGGSFFCWSCAREGRGELIAVDDWSSKTQAAFLNNVRDYGVPVKIYTMKSWEAAQYIPGQLAFVFVDANHAEGIWEDVNVWPDKIMPGGIIAFHDYGVKKQTVQVKMAVDDWLRSTYGDWLYIGQVGSTIAFRRKGAA